MPIDPVIAKKYADKLAVSCCNVKAGTIISHLNFEDPMLLPELIKSNLIKLPENCLTIGEVIGTKLLIDIPAMTPYTSEMISKTDYNKNESILNKSTSNQLFTNYKNQDNEKILRTLIKKHYKINCVEFGEETKIKDNILYLDRFLLTKALQEDDLVVSFDVDIITQNDYQKYSETIMDIQPLATKEQGKIGNGVTRILDGVVLMVTGTDEKGVQIGEFGSSEGILERNMMWGRPGAADYGDIIVKTKVIIKSDSNMQRPGPFAAHKASDVIAQGIRDALKDYEGEPDKVDSIHQIQRKGKKKIVIVKEIMGQGAMHDNLILPVEPCGILGGKSIIDLGNIPVMLSPLEVLDGGIRALTCIGPASKETSRHYWREPLIIEAVNDSEIDLCGVIFIGSPQVNYEKFYVSERLGMMIEALGVDGAIITTEGFGNNHIDFASHHEQIGTRGIPTVGLTFAGVQGALVVGNHYMDAMIDLNKSAQGIENEILANNTLCYEDAIRALTMIKHKINGIEVIPSDKEWNEKTKLENIKAIEEGLSIKIPLSDNETSLKLSKKRREIYETEVDVVERSK